MGGQGSGRTFGAKDAEPRKFDPERHCGAAAKYRSREVLTRRIQQHSARLKALKPSGKNYEVKRDWQERLLKIYKEQLDKIIQFPDDRPCMNVKGYGTDHDGEGKCHWHCQCHGRVGYHEISGNIYTKIRHKKLQEAIQMVELQTIDIMDLVPEAKMLKAMTVLFFEDVQRKKHVPTKDIEAAANMIEKTAKVIEKINAIQLKAGVVTHAAVVGLTQGMANEMLFAAQEQDGQVFDAQKFIEAVKIRWGSLSIDSTAKALPVPRSERPAV